MEIEKEIRKRQFNYMLQILTLREACTHLDINKIPKTHDGKCLYCGKIL